MINVNRNRSSKGHLHVSCAIIQRSGRIMAAQRSAAMKMPLKWEFPGGKIRSDEDAESGLRRELIEELGIEITVLHALPSTTHEYPDIRVTLHPFVCSIKKNEPQLKEHAALKWLPAEEVYSLDLAEADLPVLDAYRRWLKETDR